MRSSHSRVAVKVEKHELLRACLPKKVLELVFGVGDVLCAKVELSAQVVFRGQDGAELVDARKHRHAVHADSVTHEVQKPDRNLPNVRVLDLHLQMTLARPQEVAGVLGAHPTHLDRVRVLVDVQHLLHGSGDARREVLHVIARVHVALPAVHNAVVVVFGGHEILGLQAVAGDVAV